MENPDQERRDSLRVNGWTQEPQASVWVSLDGKSVKTFLPDGTEIESGCERAIRRKSYNVT